jgi:hypothetical protein
MNHDDKLDLIYQAYPRHRNRRQALAQIDRSLRRVQAGECGKKNLCESAAWAFLLDRTKAFAQSWAGNRGHYTPLPGTWFNRSGYLDDENEWDLVTREEYIQISNQREAAIGR